MCMVDIFGIRYSDGFGYLPRLEALTSRFGKCRVYRVLGLGQVWVQALHHSRSASEAALFRCAGLLP
jgi:hypothetical protein